MAKFKIFYNFLDDFHPLSNLYSDIKSAREDVISIIVEDIFYDKFVATDPLSGSQHEVDIVTEKISNMSDEKIKNEFGLEIREVK